MKQLQRSEHVGSRRSMKRVHKPSKIPSSKTRFECEQANSCAEREKHLRPTVITRQCQGSFEYGILATISEQRGMSLATAASHHNSEKITNELMIRVFEERAISSGDIQCLRASRYAIGQDRKPAYSQGVSEERTHAAVMASLKDEYTELADMNRAQH
jgi:hypothetical protein